VTGQRRLIIPECLIKLDDGDPVTERHWYCDVAAVDLTQEKVLLSEVTYAKRPGALHKRLREWADNWAGVRGALKRDYGIPLEWQVLPQVFVSEECGPEILTRAQADVAVDGVLTAVAPRPAPA
jgi:hypothetical protein